MKSEKLRIRVMKRGKTRVELTFGAQVTENLADLVPDDLHSALVEQSIDIEAIALHAKQNGYAPGELFDLEEGDRRLLAWLE